MCLNSSRQRPYPARASHKMIPIVEDLLVELLELNDVREHVLEHVLRVLRVVGQLAGHPQDVCALPREKNSQSIKMTNITMSPRMSALSLVQTLVAKHVANTFNRMTKNKKII